MSRVKAIKNPVTLTGPQQKVLIQMIDNAGGDLPVKLVSVADLESTEMWVYIEVQQWSKEHLESHPDLHNPSAVVREDGTLAKSGKTIEIYEKDE